MGVLVIVKGWHSVARCMCQYPFVKSSFIKTFAPSNRGYRSLICGNGWCSGTRYWKGDVSHYLDLPFSPSAQWLGDVPKQMACWLVPRCHHSPSCGSQFSPLHGMQSIWDEVPVPLKLHHCWRSCGAQSSGSTQCLPASVSRTDYQMCQSWQPAGTALGSRAWLATCRVAVGSAHDLGLGLFMFSDSVTWGVWSVPTIWCLSSIIMLRTLMVSMPQMAVLSPSSMETFYVACLSP